MATRAKHLTTVEQELDARDAAETAKMRIWSALSKTDPAHTKGFKRSGGFSGTAIKPIWVTQRLTEQFGPCGAGWGFEAPQFQLVTAGDDILVYCTVTAWYLDGGKQHFIYGVGGDQVRGKNKYGFYSDDEAFKKAFTDALGNAFKFVGVGADVHMGLFEDSKYLAQVNAEFHPPANEGSQSTGEPRPRERVKLDGPYTCPTQLKAAAKQFVMTLDKMGDMGELIAWENTADYCEFVEQCQRDMPSWWEGDETMPAEFIPLAIRVANKRRELEELETIR